MATGHGEQDGNVMRPKCSPCGAPLYPWGGLHVSWCPHRRERTLEDALAVAGDDWHRWLTAFIKRETDLGFSEWCQITERADVGSKKVGP